MSSQDTPKDPDPALEMAPDPEEDDLDDLDDMLDQFSATKVSDKTADASVPSSSGPGRPPEAITTTTSSTTAPAAPGAEDDFTKQLQAGMAELLGELESNPEMAQQFEDMLGRFGAPAADTQPASSQTKSAVPATSATSKATEDNFQDTIQRTIKRMEQSSASASASAAASNPSAASEDPSEALFAQLLAGFGVAPNGADSEDPDSFSKMLLGMMEQLTNKDILYEPMKELDTKFPAWLEEREPGGTKAGEVPQAEMERYKQQRKLVGEIVTRFERAGYTDGDAGDREYIVARMQEMQEAGAPPQELVGDVDAAQAMMGGLDPEGCPTQ